MVREEKKIENHDHSFTIWIKEHKKSLFIVGGTIVTIGVGYAVYKNRDSITTIFKSIKPESIVIEKPQVSAKVAIPVVDVIPEISTETVNKIINNGEAFRVREHLRNLPNGRNASAQKIVLASQYGIKLGENQTWVENHLKNCA